MWYWHDYLTHNVYKIFNYFFRSRLTTDIVSWSARLSYSFGFVLWNILKSLWRLSNHEKICGNELCYNELL